MEVVYQGVKGAYSQIAINCLFKGRKVKPVGVSTFERIFEDVSRKKCKYGLLPLENSLTGSIHQSYDLLAKYDLKILGEIYLRIVHNLLAIPRPEIKDKKKRLKTIEKVYSHPQALLQCQEFFKSHPWMEAIPTADTAGSAKELAEQKNSEAAVIASSEAARIYKLEVLKEGIETDKNNFTRFVLIGRKRGISKANKVSLVFSVRHIPGSLYESLKPFAKRKINLTKIESRPIIGKPWEYLFYLDFETGSANREYLEAIKELKKHCLYLKVLGFYKKGEIKP